MWTFSYNGSVYQNGAYRGSAYAGKGIGKNNAEMQDVPFVGPLPCGMYRMGDPVDNPETGLYSIPLIPSPANQMFGRSRFFWHGENPAHPGQSSDGCPVSPLPLRMEAIESADRDFQVVSGQ